MTLLLSSDSKESVEFLHEDIVVKRVQTTMIESRRRRRRQCVPNITLWLAISVLLSSLLSPSSFCHAHLNNNQNNKATLTIFDFTSWSFRGEIATFFGVSNFEHNSPSAYHSTLMLPPQNYSTLCEIPEHLLRQYGEMLQETATNDNSTATNTSVMAEVDEEDSATSSSTLTPNPLPSPNETRWRFPGSVSMLVSSGDCHPLRKVQVALWLQKHVSFDLKFIVLYNNDPNDVDSIVTLDVSVLPSDEDSDSDFLVSPTTTREDWRKLLKESGMIFVSVSTGTGTSLLGRMDRLASNTNSSPEFANPNALQKQWHLPMVLEKIHSDRFRPPTWVQNDNNSNNSNSGRQRFDANDSFYWFRFVLFTLLIVSPCLRAAYLWWVGGGRVRLRRRPEDGRIIGLQYTPPMAHWFGIYGHHQDSEGAAPIHDRLTEEEVMALPEIVYHKLPQGKESRCDEEGEDETHVGSSEDEMGDVKKDGTTPNDHVKTISTTLLATVGSGNATAEDGIPALVDDEEFSNGSFSRTSTGTSTDLQQIHLELSAIPTAMSEKKTMPGRERVQSMDEEQPPIGECSVASTPIGPFTTTKCNTCSICIDEFEDGERLRLLPRCGHAFHTECILPWLVERQGCCPLCKTSVLGTEVHESDGGENDGIQEQITPQNTSDSSNRSL